MKHRLADLTVRAIFREVYAEWAGCPYVHVDALQSSLGRLLLYARGKLPLGAVEADVVHVGRLQGALQGPACRALVEAVGARCDLDQGEPLITSQIAQLGGVHYRRVLQLVRPEDLIGNKGRAGLVSNEAARRILDELKRIDVVRTLG